MRTVNYLHQTPRYISLDEDQHIRTETYFCEVNNDLTIKSAKRIRNGTDYIKHRQTHVTCWEDMRLFYYKDNFWVIATGIDTHYQKSHQMVLGKLSITKSECCITETHLLNYAGWNIQKNWLPVPKGDELFIIYRYEPFTVLKYDETAGKLTQVVQKTQHSVYCDGFRGSSVPFYCPIKNRWIMLVHFGKWMNGKENTYIHRFIEMDDDWNITKTGTPFQTKKHHMEYVMGATNHPDSKPNNPKIVMCLSENDSDGSIGYKDLRSL